LNVTVLADDLEGTLPKSDMLFESFWSDFGRDWRSQFMSVGAVIGGRASLKRDLAVTSDVEVNTLPYDPDVIAFVREWRSLGGRAAPVTSSNHDFSDAVAEHLSIFDEVHGSYGKLYLKSERKRQCFEERFDSKGFAYMGDVNADLLFWKRASKTINVNASDTLRRQAERVRKNVGHLDAETKSIQPYVKAVRPHQWLKNTLVFLPVLAAHQLDSPTMLLSSSAFVRFSLVVSSVYVLNDLLDLAADRAHPCKRLRPFFSGRIAIAHATWVATRLLNLGVLPAIIIGPLFLLAFVAYYLLTTAYSLHFKRRIVIEIFVLAGLYDARIIVYGIATGFPLSVWVLAFSVFFVLCLAGVKRQAKHVDSAERGSLKTSGRGSDVNDLPIISIADGYVSVLVLTLYVNSPKVIEIYTNPEALWGAFALPLHWINGTVMIARRGNKHDDPVVYAEEDRISQTCLLIILSFLLGGVQV